MVATTKVHVFVNRRKVELGQEQISGQQLLVAAGFEGQGWDLLRLQGEGDPTGGTLIMFNETISVKPGDHFRVIPGNRTFGVAFVTAPAELAEHLDELCRVTGLRAEIIEDSGRLNVVIYDVPLPFGRFRVSHTDVLLHADYQYPLSAMDMFWTVPDVVRADGTVPQGADVLGTYLGRRWRRFSWHRNGIWNPAGNPLLDHFAFVEARFAEVRG